MDDAVMWFPVVAVCLMFDTCTVVSWTNTGVKTQDVCEQIMKQKMTQHRQAFGEYADIGEVYGQCLPLVTKHDRQTDTILAWLRGHVPGVHA